MAYKSLTTKKQEQAGIIYLVLAALFIAALVTCNLIANKFVEVDMGFRSFRISAGVLPYPLTFLFTDLLSEIYGRRNASRVVLAGFFASLLVLLILWLGHQFPAIEQSPVSQAEYQSVFENSWRVILSSMLAYLVAQLVDVRIFHHLKLRTGGKALWLRNNFSTMFSQLVDTILVTSAVFIGIKGFSEISALVFDGWLFKVLFAAADTLVIYPLVFGLRRYFGLSAQDELSVT